MLIRQLTSDLSFTARHPRVYAKLKAEGHSTAKAIEIILDATRGNKWALAWIRAICRRK